MKYDTNSRELFEIDRDLATFHAMGDRNRARDILATHLARAVAEGRHLAQQEAIEQARQNREFLKNADAHFVTADGFRCVDMCPEIEGAELLPTIFRPVSSLTTTKLDDPSERRTGTVRRYYLTGHHSDGRPIYTEQP